MPSAMGGVLPFAALFAGSAVESVLLFHGLTDKGPLFGANFGDQL